MNLLPQMLSNGNADWKIGHLWIFQQTKEVQVLMFKKILYFKMYATNLDFGKKIIWEKMATHQWWGFWLGEHLHLGTFAPSFCSPVAAVSLQISDQGHLLASICIPSSPGDLVYSHGYKYHLCVNDSKLSSSTFFLNIKLSKSNCLLVINCMSKWVTWVPHSFA